MAHCSNLVLYDVLTMGSKENVTQQLSKVVMGLKREKLYLGYTGSEVRSDAKHSDTSHGQLD